MAEKRVVIAGFGDTGVLVAAHLKSSCEITAISPKPALVSGQELGTRLSDPELWKQNYLFTYDRYRALDKVTVLHGKLSGMDPEAKTSNVTLADGSTQTLPYDALVLATGTTNGFWRTAEMESLADITDDIHQRAADMAGAETLAIIGGGPSGVSVASNLKLTYPDKKVHLFCSRELPLPDYHPDTRKRIAAKLAEQGVVIHPNHRAEIPQGGDGQAVTSGVVRFVDGHEDFVADRIIWTVGACRPNNEGIAPSCLDADGFVRVDDYLRVLDTDGVFAIGDIAATDPHRSSARNAGFYQAARNVDAYLRGKPRRMKKFKPPGVKWGSILGLQNDGLTIYSPKGKPFRLSRRFTQGFLLPVIVWRVIYRGIRKV
ncbi:MAG: NAD(P)/FAD-dependent oxidoreductase [Parvibaculales bacterium]